MSCLSMRSEEPRAMEGAIQETGQLQRPARMVGLAETASIQSSKDARRIRTDVIEWLRGEG